MRYKEVIAMKPAVPHTITGVNDVQKIVEPLRKLGKTLVTTNGCLTCFIQGI
jgi:hypothetical protein